MLVLTRRPNEAVVFPGLEVLIRVLKLKGNAVQIGIDAPQGVTVLREELVDPNAPPPVQPKQKLTHALCNELNKINLTLHCFQQQWQTGQTDAAGKTLVRLTGMLETMDRDWIADQVRESMAPPPPAPRPSRRVRSLVVEDDNNERELLAGLLNMNGCDCETAADGAEALQYLSTHDRPDLVLLDLRMPRCDGRQTLAEIRHNPRYEGLKVFAISGTAPQELGIGTGPDGVDAWFPKPLSSRKLWDAIRATVAN